MPREFNRRIKPEQFDTTIEYFQAKNPLISSLMRAADLEVQIGVGEFMDYKDLEALVLKNNKQLNKKPMAFAKKEAPAKAAESKKTEEKKSEIIFPKGILVFEPHAKAPDFVKAEIVINADEFTAFLAENSAYLSEHDKYGTQLKLTMQESKDGKLFLKVNTFGTEAGK